MIITQNIRYVCKYNVFRILFVSEVHCHVSVVFCCLYCFYVVVIVVSLDLFITLIQLLSCTTFCQPMSGCLFRARDTSSLLSIHA